MASIFQPGGLLGPIAPGMSGAVNPLAFIGAGMATGDMGTQLARMGQLQQQAAQLRFQQEQQQQRLQAMRQQAAMEQQAAAAEQAQQQQMAALAPRLFPNDPTMQAMAAVNPAMIPKLYLQQHPAPTNPERLYNAMVATGGTDKTFAEWYATDFKGPGTVVNVGGEPKFGAVPSGMARIPDPTAPTGTRLVEEPGAPAAAKREAERAEKIAPLTDLQDSLNRYKSVLRQYGPEIMAGEGKTRLDAAYTDLLLKQKNAAELGALQAADLALMERMMIDPTGMAAQWYEKTGNTQALFGQLDQMEKTLDAARARAEGREPEAPRAIGTMESPTQITGDEEYDQLEDGEFYIGPDGIMRVK